jgi:hypothetical protein
MLLAIKEIYPTQVSTFFLLTNVFHAYIKQNTPIFFLVCLYLQVVYYIII